MASYVPKKGDHVFVDQTPQTFVRYEVRSVDSAKKTVVLHNVDGDVKTAHLDVPWRRLIKVTS